MTIFISRGCYTVDAVRGMISAPENREEAVAKLLKEFGGRLISYYLTFGEFDWLLVAEFPNEKLVSSAILAAVAGGSVTNVQTTVALTAKDATAAFSGAGVAGKSFKNAGR
jgi:uncharacterized protein with GYD domain